MHATYLDAIRQFEGFTPRASWDYAQFTNGFGTKAKYAGEVIDKAEADKRFQAEIAQARAIVERHAPTASEGTKAALTSLTFNAGDRWAKSGLGEAIRSGDTEKARDLFLQYNKAGGEVLPGLVKRRIAEAEWIGGQLPGAGSPSPSAATAVASLPNYGQPPAVSNGFAVPTPPQRAAADLMPAQFEHERLATETPAEQMTSDEVEDELLSKISAAVSGYGGEARMTQLLLATKLIGAPSAADDQGPAGESAV